MSFLGTPAPAEILVTGNAPALTVPGDRTVAPGPAQILVAGAAPRLLVYNEAGIGFTRVTVTAAIGGRLEVNGG